MPLVNNKIVFFEVLPAVKFILNEEPPAVKPGDVKLVIEFV